MTYDSSFEPQTSSPQLAHESSRGPVSDVPAPGRYYAIQPNAGGLLTTAGRAYGVAAGAKRLAWAQKINAHPLNRPFRRPTENAFERTHFGQSIISFSPRFPCGSGKCFARIWLPPARPVYHPYLGQGVLVSGFDEPTAPGLSDTEPDGPPILDRVSAAGRVDTTKAPFRWICRVALFARGPSGLTRFHHGTGTLVGPRHVLTAAHIFDYVWDDDPSSLIEVLGITVAPGADGIRLPFLAWRAEAWRAHPRWRANAKRPFDFDARFDIGMIKLKRPIGGREFRALKGRQLGFWGSARGEGTVLQPPRIPLADGGKLNIAGYPKAKEQGLARQMLVPATIRSVHPTLSGGRGIPELLTYDGDTGDGYSGGPVWHWDKEANTRHLIAVHHGGCQDIPGPQGGAMNNCVLSRNPEGAIVRTSPTAGVVLTQPVMDLITAWKLNM